MDTYDPGFEAWWAAYHNHYEIMTAKEFLHKCWMDAREDLSATPKTGVPGIDRAGADAQRGLWSMVVDAVLSGRTESHGP